MAKKTDFKVPFDHRGMQQYPQERSYIQGFNFRWEDNRVFEETLTLIGMSRGRSAAGFQFEDSKGQHYYMFLKSMEKLIRNHVIDHGKVTGKWTFVKRGANYGIEYLGE